MLNDIQNNSPILEVHSNIQIWVNQFELRIYIHVANDHFII